MATSRAFTAKYPLAVSARHEQPARHARAPVSCSSYCPVTLRATRWVSASNTTGGPDDGGAGHRLATPISAARSRRGFRDAGHRVVIAGARRDDLEVAAKELDVDAIVLDNTDPASLEEAATAVPPPPRHDRQRARARAGTAATRGPTRWPIRPPRGATLSTRRCCRAVLTVQILGDHLRSGGSIVNVVAREPARGQRRGGDQGRARRLDRRAGRTTSASAGITVNAVASGRSARAGLRRPRHDVPPSVADEIARLALFLTTPAARHITGQTLHVSHGALANFG